MGTVFAFSHLFIAYKVPVSVPYIFSLANLTSAVSSDVSSVVSTATSTASAGVGSWIKKVALRAAGAEGVAENVENESGQPFGIDAIHAAKDLKSREEVRYRDEMQLTHCTDTSGQVFAVLFNIFYLLPLTVLFVRFFLKSYVRRFQKQRDPSKVHVAEQAGNDARKGFARQLMEDLGNMHGTDTPAGYSPVEPGSPGSPTTDKGKSTSGDDMGKSTSAGRKGKSASADEVKVRLEHLKDINKEVEAAKSEVDATKKEIHDSEDTVNELKEAKKSES